MSTNYRVAIYKEQYTMVELVEEDSRSSVTICPERGGIAIQCRLNGYELFYLDKETFLDPEANIRGGNPVLFPISGQLEDGQYEWNGTTYTMKNHGVARTEPWEIVETSFDGRASVTLKLTSSAKTKEQFPFDFELLFTYTLRGGELLIEQQYRNLSDTPMPMYPGFHPYFATNEKNIAYKTDATRYLDYNDMIEKKYEGALNLEGMKESAALLDPVKPEISFELSDAVNVRMKYSDLFKTVVLWSVDGKPFVCVEPWMALTGELNRRDELVFVEPGDAVEAELTFSCEPRSAAKTN
ncbi:aldose epimerase [Paenibacillus beijingensis]|uniref:Aldose epimerase n=1 Tax=Paenibacillus beijingensis TaxID=1126833 RepID=A0A0D5NGS6_9BACL|nr:aldose epimerase [Paenibacillus beijingensis]AJY74481.1 aldose epimerase [Paenibacillus beijingensis]